MASEKAKALAEFLNCPVSAVEALDDKSFSVIGRKEYLVLSEVEADLAAKAAVLDSLWAFNASFILAHCGLPSELVPAIKRFQEEECEDANPALLALVTKCCGVDKFVASALRADGRGHFLSSYDGHEHEVKGLFIYRVN